MFRVNSGDYLRWGSHLTAEGEPHRAARLARFRMTLRRAKTGELFANKYWRQRERELQLFIPLNMHIRIRIPRQAGTWRTRAESISMCIVIDHGTFEKSLQH